MTTSYSGNQIDISIVIVNYNVKEYLANLLHSIEEARHDFGLQIIVVDNQSTDNSIPFLKERFPDVEYIVNQENLGFGKANNQAFAIAKGKYTLIVNPDVLISEDTLVTLYNHMESRPETGACGCKILNPDGSFAMESRRSIPTPMTALYKVLGLTAMFPESKRFGAYYMGWLDENNAAEVDVLSGSFMFYRTDVLRELNGFDERFFMYGEDIDLCYRTLELGYKIDYVPETSIIHYKGESTKKENLRYIIHFNKVLYQFFEKHYSYGYTFLFRLLIFFGVITKTVITYGLTIFRKTLRPLIDVVTLNLVVITLFMIRFQIQPADFTDSYQLNYLAVNGFLTLFFLLFSKYFDLYGKHLHSFSKLLKSLLLTFIAVTTITFFIRDFAFSRLVLLASLGSLSVLLPAYRFISMNLRTAGGRAADKLRSEKILIVGLDDKTAPIIRKMRAEVEWNYEIVGIVSHKESPAETEVEQVPVVGHLSQISEIIQSRKADQVIFILDLISHMDVLKTLAQIRDLNVISKVVPGSMDYIIGKSNVEYFDDVAVVDLELPTQTAWNRFLKRGLDFWGSLLGLIVMSPFYLAKNWLKKTDKAHNKRVPIYVDSSTTINFNILEPAASNRVINYYRFLVKVLIGEFSLVGAPMIRRRQGRFIYYKPGLTGLRQINEKRLYRDEEKERYEIHYLQSYTIWKDFEILIRAVFGWNKPFYEYPDEQNIPVNNPQ